MKKSLIVASKRLPKRISLGIGKVVSTKMDQTALVEIIRNKINKLYGKRYKRSSKYFAHNQNNQYQVGDDVRIVENRPISKLKHWSIVEKVNK